MCQRGDICSFFKTKERREKKIEGAARLFYLLPIIVIPVSEFDAEFSSATVLFVNQFLVFFIFSWSPKDHLVGRS